MKLVKIFVEKRTLQEKITMKNKLKKINPDLKNKNKKNKVNIDNK